LSADASDTPLLHRLLTRDTLVVSASLVSLTALAWWYTVRLARGMDMGGMDMTGFQMVSTGARMVMAPAAAPWTAREFLLMFAMWAVMMIGMMTPSASPLILLYARVGRQAARDGKTVAAAGWFAGGYLLAWSAFALAATTAQWALQRAAALSPDMRTASAPAGGVLLIVAGLYQWSSLKDVCLAHCQSPISFLQRHGGFRRDASGSVTLGLRHGVYCVGCCWILMALLFVGGVMNLAWIAGLSILVLLEKLTPAGRLIGRLTGVALVAAGAWTFL
jgi:predicted metal-binding membrane protein